MSDVCFPESIVKTRKDHLCHGCCRKFPKGSKMLKSAGGFDGSCYTIYTCETCQEIMKKVDTSYYRDEGFQEGWVIEEKNNSKQTPEEYLTELLTKGEK